MTREKIADTTTGITMELYQGEVDSVIFLKDEHGIIGRKYYTRRIHKYESRSDFDRMNTQLQTYGYQHGLLPEWERLQSK